MNESLAITHGNMQEEYDGCFLKGILFFFKLIELICYCADTFCMNFCLVSKENAMVS